MLSFFALALQIIDCWYACFVHNAQYRLGEVTYVSCVFCPHVAQLTSAACQFVTPAEVNVLLQLAESVNQHARSTCELELVVSHTKHQERLLAGFPRLRDYSSLEALLAVGLEELGRICEFEATAAYLWREEEQCYRLVAGGMHSWCKLHETIRPGDGVMSKLNEMPAAHVLRVSKDEFAAAVFISHNDPAAGEPRGQRTCSLIVGIRDSDVPLCDHEQRLLASFRHWLTVVTREYVAMDETQATQHQHFLGQSKELSGRLEYDQAILRDWQALSSIRQFLLQEKSSVLFEQEDCNGDWKALIATGLKHIMDNVPERFEVSLVDEAVDNDRDMYERQIGSASWVKQMIKQGVVYRGYVKVQRLNKRSAEVAEDASRHQDELLAAELAAMIEDLLLLERVSTELQRLQAATALRPAETLAALCETASKLFGNTSQELQTLRLPEPHPANARELLALIVFANSLVNEMAPCLSSDDGIRGLLDIIQRTVPLTLCDCLFFNIHWPSTTHQESASPLAAGMVAHVQVRSPNSTSLTEHYVVVRMTQLPFQFSQRLGQPMTVTDSQANTRVSFFPVQHNGQVLAVLEIGQQGDVLAEPDATTATTKLLDTVRACVSALIHKIATSWQSSPTCKLHGLRLCLHHMLIPSLWFAARQIWAKTFQELANAVAAESASTMLPEGAAIALELFRATAAATLSLDGSSFKGIVCTPDTPLHKPAVGNVVHIPASELPQDMPKPFVLELEQSMLNSQHRRQTATFRMCMSCKCVLCRGDERS